MITTFRCLLNDTSPDDGLPSGTEGSILFFPSLPDAVADAYAVRATGATYLLRADPVLLDRRVKGAASTWDALVAEEKATAAAASERERDLVELRRLAEKYPEVLPLQPASGNGGQIPIAPAVQPVAFGGRGGSASGARA